MIIGIDLGTTNSCAAYTLNGNPIVIKNTDGTNTTPSVVTFKKDGTSYIGNDAKARRVVDALDTVWSAKRFMGRSFSAVKNEFAAMPYAFTCDYNDNICVVVGGRRFTVTEIASYVLSSVKESAEIALNEKITEAVITVPAYFTDAQREATRQAGELAGLTVRRIISEPTAAALAYGHVHNINGNIAVYDLGGGTFDISVLHIKDGNFNVLSTSGDTMLGGDDIDRRVSDFLIRQARSEIGVDLFALSSDPVTKTVATYARQKIRDAAEKAKIALSDTSIDFTDVEIPNLYNGKDFKTRLHRDNFNHMVSFVVDKTLKLCDEAIAKANCKIDQIVLVGGSTKSPYIRERIAKHFHITPDTSINPDEAVALGAAIQASMLESNKLSDVTPLDLGILCRKGRSSTTIVPVLKANTSIPTSFSRTFTTSRDNQDTIDLSIMQGVAKLGLLKIELKSAPKGTPRVTVEFTVDSDGILSVKATDLSTGSVKQTTLKKHVN